MYNQQKVQHELENLKGRLLKLMAYLKRKDKLSHNFSGKFNKVPPIMSEKGTRETNRG